MSSTGTTPTIGQEAVALIQEMLLSDAALANADVQVLVSAAVAKGIAAGGDPNVAIPALASVAITAPLMAPELIPEFLLQGLKTFQALQKLLQTYLASKLPAVPPGS